MKDRKALYLSELMEALRAGSDIHVLRRGAHMLYLALIEAELTAQGTRVEPRGARAVILPRPVCPNRAPGNATELSHCVVSEGRRNMNAAKHWRLEKTKN